MRRPLTIVDRAAVDEDGDDALLDLLMDLRRLRTRDERAAYLAAQPEDVREAAFAAVDLAGDVTLAAIDLLARPVTMPGGKAA